MLLFAIITVLGLGGVLFRQTYVRFRAEVSKEGRGPSGRSALGPAAYWTWILRRAGVVFRPDTAGRIWSVYRDWTDRHYAGWTKWFFGGLTVSLLYQAASGFFFGIFFRRGMFGLPLLVHVMSGGLFAISLAGVMLLRARDYLPDRKESAAFEAFACPILKNLSRVFVRKILFWVICGLGLLQITTALGSMVPLFTFRTQQVMITFHRYSALAMLLAAIVFIDITFIPQREPAGGQGLQGSKNSAA